MTDIYEIFRTLPDDLGGGDVSHGLIRAGSTEEACMAFRQLHDESMGIERYTADWDLRAEGTEPQREYLVWFGVEDFERVNASTEDHAVAVAKAERSDGKLAKHLNHTPIRVDARDWRHVLSLENETARSLTMMRMHRGEIDFSESDRRWPQ